MSEITTVPESLGHEPPATGRQLRGNLGVSSIVFMVVAAAAPLGVIGGVVPLGIASGNGTGFPATFIASTLVLLLFAVGFTAMTPYVEEAGAFFSYVRQSLGLPVGIGIAFVALVSYVALEAGVYGLLGPAGASVVELAGGPSLPWWVFAAAAFAVTTYLGYRNIELSSRVLGVLLSGEIVIVLVLDLVIVANGGDRGLSSGIVNPDAIFSGSLGVGLLFAIISYVGFEATAIFRDEARTPERTIPRATYLALVLIGVFYAVTSWALISGWGDEQAVARATDSGVTFLGDTAHRYIGAVGADIITVLYFTSLFACILAFHNVASRYVFALSQRDVLPARLSRPHDRHGSPHEASLWISGVVAVSVLLAVVFGLDPAAQFYTWFAGATTVGVVLLMIATSVAVLVFFARDRHGHSLWRVRIAPALGLAGLLGALVLILTNLNDLVGGSDVLAWAIVGVLATAFATGVAVGRRVG
ncbi:APC family permease [Mycolicibacterium fortuitum]|uniref:Amino acid permease n=1 Tax=Mycolicibacterium fortuitum subsp. fortuitum DSM 46621 = ATCC 6841 = JCM 6387 TaxID=1214102 RepID=K0V959_MYCFO|nr:APC family permease [Mycolicibacterium fortuitum]AIY46844.1 amino acid permease family protein [Mycobacterium sp. VKM Ac-1817D]EJZ15441.1 amino acid permease [Mycolicibacterium fortuitum subsp. fortuitum DSM 46621 = ATCC 6841 = JCM 6387]WEV30309.1 APC family permease [Mycolicibacterium fortuitum]CRL57168.1 amino acid permease [Mycolicibacterium fortuitum subsp. fortuitum DSM 46621 = ATCC 6841 = JCM 6387]BDD99185.1 amino acid transporter [Mycolicibacterium fortuitum subsp. fortuitum]